MQLFKCTHCSSPIYFENTQCGNCGSSLGFLPESMHPVALSPGDPYRYCANHSQDTCNWLVPINDPSPFCKACELNRTIPDLSKPDYVTRWKKLETAKHRLIYALLKMKLPLMSKASDPEKGLAFDFVADQPAVTSQAPNPGQPTNQGQPSNQGQPATQGQPTNPTQPATPAKKIFTGYQNGLITINIAEADDIEREMARKSMHEVYRTLLGHFRHEIGHYYWERLIDASDKTDPFRKLFGDERADYKASLQRYYDTGPPADWNEHYISAYASSHPWEDWAETWAHYMHIADTLETAYSFGLSVDPLIARSSDEFKVDILASPYNMRNFETIIKYWMPLSFALNSLNRSMGLNDIYPFVISEPAKEKMAFIHSLIRSRT